MHVYRLCLHKNLDLTVCAMRTWKRVTFLPRRTRSLQAYRLRVQKDLDLAYCALRSWKRDIRLSFRTRAAVLSRAYRAWDHVVHRGVRLAAMLAPYQSALATAQKLMAFRDWTRAAFKLEAISTGHTEGPAVVQLPAVSRGVSHAAGFMGGGRF